ncbi:MAG: hypothetical protein M1834_005481 [Cirrosporium novae-zelandiae]|nr:MAG: hypothetical protein M1834_005481 [Cirrosporium novae-zelandiae]
MASSTPSPSASITATSTSPNTISPNTTSANSTPHTTPPVSRRPPRKSTLTQQQKNQKRQRATQEQLVILETEFAKNPTPTAAVRERIAQEINMTERSVQIWFQNSRRRAKIKLMAKRSLETGEDLEGIPEAMRRHLALQALEQGQPLAGGLFGHAGGPMGYGNGSMVAAEPQNPKQVFLLRAVIYHLNCRSLTIGTWRRIAQNTMDLVIFYSPAKTNSVTYYINNDGAGYKIEYPFAYIKNITLDVGDVEPKPDGSPSRPAGLVIELLRPPNFFMDAAGNGGFFQCMDFTADQQASQIMVHHLGGPPKVLSAQLEKLTALESYKNRHNTFDVNALPPQTPVSPQRPASQPNYYHPNLGMYQDNFGTMLGPPRGHKRTRSKSVPAAVDFSMMQGPMPILHIQQPSTQMMPEPNIFAPIPQAPNMNSFGPNNLRIDTTSSNFAMDSRAYPLSAATTNSPSDYASPSFFSAPPTSDPSQGQNMNSPYNIPFLSPMMDTNSGMIPQSISPISVLSNGDPIIADHSPPMSTLQGNDPSDIFALPSDQSGLSDDGFMLSEMYAKQNLGSQMPSPEYNDPTFGMSQEQQPDSFSGETDMYPMAPYGTIDPSALSNPQGQQL